MKEKLTTFLSSLPVHVLSRLILGGLFIYASFHKITEPLAFAKIIHNYQILPLALIYISALVLPWVELLSGLFLVAGIFKRTAAIILVGLLAVFVIAIAFNLARGLNFDCGCFSNVASEEATDPVGLLFRDLLIMIPGLIVIFFQPKKQKATG